VPWFAWSGIIPASSEVHEVCKELPVGIAANDAYSQRTLADRASVQLDRCARTDRSIRASFRRLHWHHECRPCAWSVRSEHHLGQRTLSAQTGRTSDSKRSGQKSATILTCRGPSTSAISTAASPPTKLPSSRCSALSIAMSATWHRFVSDYPAPVIRNTDTGRELAMMRWGMPPPPRTGGQPVTNIRNTTSPHRRGWLKPENRCLVPANVSPSTHRSRIPKPGRKDVVWVCIKRRQATVRVRLQR
jgi:hypothetical protein